MTSLLFVASMMLCAIDWRLGGMYGARYGNRYYTAAIVTALCWPIMYPYFGEWTLLYFLWFGVGEHSGWKPKFAKEKGTWWDTAISGLVLGGVGMLLVPLSTWAHQQHWFYPPPKWPAWLRRFLEADAQNELWMGALAPLVAPTFWALLLPILAPCFQRILEFIYAST